MKEESKKTKNKNINTIKILTIVLLIILISMIGFFGIYAQEKNQMKNSVKDYSYAMDINGARTLKLQVNKETSEVIKDKDGNVIKSATDEEIQENGYTKEQVANNSDDVLTEENYKEVKSIIEKRLKKSNIQDYNISVNNITGDITLEIPEDENTDTVISNLNTIGKFEIIDTDTNEVLLDNSNIKTSDVLYNTTTSGTSVYLQIEFNKEGKKKLEEISKTYVKTENNTTSNSTESEENTSDNNTTTTSEKTEKTITMKINDEDIMTTSFDEAITTGKIQLSVGTATTDTTTLKGYITQAQSVAVVLDGGKLPIQYDLVKNEYILSNITEQDLGYVAIAISVIAIIAIIVLVIIFKLKGLLAGISFIGFAAVYMLLIRYTNVVISLESIFGIISILILNYIFMFNLLKNIEKMDKNVKKSTIETYKKFFNRIIPICILAIAFCFVKWNPINSFGMITFWGIVMIAIYNVIVTANLLNLETKDKE